MRKHIIIASVLLLPTALFAQSALHQLESLAGQSIHDVHVPPVPDPTPVDVEEEEEQEQQSTHLKDYTPAQETQPAQPKPKTAEEIWQEEWRKEEQRQNERNGILYEKRKEYENDLDKEKGLIRRHYERFIEGQPIVRPVPQFSSVGERNIMFDNSKSIQELGDWGPFYLRDYNDTLFRADYIRYVQHGYTGLHSSMVRFLGMRLANGRVEWRMFEEGWNWRNFEYTDRNLTAYFEKKELPTNTKIRCQDIWDVKMAAEGKVFLLEMKNGNTVVIRPNGDFLCEGRNISFHGQIDGMVFVECDGKLYCSGAPLYTEPILTGDEFEYFYRTIIVKNHDANNQPYYRMATYGGKCYDIQKHEWTRDGKHDQYSYLQMFKNDGDHFIAKPKGKDYYVILAYCGGLFKGQKKYKTLEEAHAAWPQEKKYIYNKGDKHPRQGAKLKE